METVRLGLCLVLPSSGWEVFGCRMLHISLFLSHPTPAGCAASSPEHHPGMGSEITIFVGIMIKFLLPALLAQDLAQCEPFPSLIPAFHAAGAGSCWDKR